MRRSVTLSIAICVALTILAATLLYHRAPSSKPPPAPKQNETALGPKYYGYFEVFDHFISTVFRDALLSNPNLSGYTWSENSAHIRNAALQSNTIVVPHSVENPRAYLYDPQYLKTCREEGLSIVLFVNTVAKYCYFYDPRPCSLEEKKKLLVEEMTPYEERFRPFRDQIVAVYAYDEPWVRPLNVTRRMIQDICNAARSVFWEKPVIVMFHRQGNTLRFTAPNGSIVSYDQWVKGMPEACDIVGVDPYFYAFHDNQTPDYRHTGDKGIVESDVSWACSFGKPVVLVGQAFDPGSALFFDRDNTDPMLDISQGFENVQEGSLPEGWMSAGDGISVTDVASHRGNRSLSFNPGNGSSVAFSFPPVHSVTISFYAAFQESPSFWIAVGDGQDRPARLGFAGREMVIDDGSKVEVVNKSVDVSPRTWHPITIYVDADSNRWTVWFDGDPQTRLPYASLPTIFSTVTFLEAGSRGKVFIDDVRVQRSWSAILPDRDETMLYYRVARSHPQVEMLLWYNYPHSFASSLVREREAYQVADIWEVQREIWDSIRGQRG